MRPKRRTAPVLRSLKLWFCYSYMIVPDVPTVVHSPTVNFRFDVLKARRDRALGARP